MERRCGNCAKWTQQKFNTEIGRCAEIRSDTCRQQGTECPHFVFRFPEPKLYREGDTFDYNANTVAIKRIHAKRLDFCTALAECDLGVVDKPVMFNILDLADFFRKNPRGTLLMVKENEVGVALTKEEAERVLSTVNWEIAYHAKWDALKPARDKLAAALEEAKEAKP